MGPTGRTYMGVWGMNLSDRDEIIGMQLEIQGRELLIASEKAWEKERIFQNLPAKTEGEKE